MQPSLNYPRLRHCTIVQRDDSAPLLLVVGRNYFELTEEVGTRDQLLQLKRYFDGRHSIDEISSITGIGVGDLLGIVRTFDGAGLLRREESLPEIPKEQFLNRVQDTCLMWSHQIGYHQLFRLLEAGEVRSEVFTGLLLETYHYVKSATTHIGAAISSCMDSEWQSLLTDYLVEEQGHEEFLLATLERMGIPRQQVVDAHPIIGTIALINMLCEIGRQSTLAYFACTSLFEAREADFVEAKEGFELIGAQYGWNLEVLGPVLEHFSLDIEAGHTSLLEVALRSRRVISGLDAHIAVNYLHDLKHSFDQYHDQVLQYYSDVSNYIPRLKVDYFSL